MIITPPPPLWRGMVLDNLPAHKSLRVDQLIEAAVARVIHLPPHSPDFNPIETAISIVKTVPRKLARRRAGVLFNGISEALGLIRPPRTSNLEGAFA
jgi:transposase